MSEVIYIPKVALISKIIENRHQPKLHFLDVFLINCLIRHYKNCYVASAPKAKTFIWQTHFNITNILSVKCYQSLSQVSTSSFEFDNEIFLPKS